MGKVLFAFLFPFVVWAGPCEKFIHDLRTHRALQPQILDRGPNGRVFFHNSRLQEIFKDGLHRDALNAAVAILQEKGAFDIKMTDEGYVVAADSRGTYSKALWARDSARVIHALEGSERAKAMKALLGVMANPLNLQLFYLNIRDPAVHRMSDEDLRRHLVHNGHPLFEGMDITNSMFVPHIRFLLAQLKDPNVKPERWNMKQNDGLALVLIEGLRALEDGVIQWSELDDAQKAFFTLTLAYSVRTQFWEKWDAGAWEEANGRRTSSVGIFTEALFQFQKSRFRQEIVESAKDLSVVPEDVRALILEATTKERIQFGIESGKAIVLHQLGRGEVPDRFEDNSRQAKRHSDAALAHLLWHRPESLGEAEYRLILNHLDQLARASGTIRYEGDVYLTVGQCLPGGECLPVELMRDREKRGVVTTDDMQSAFWTKDAGFVESVYGPRFEAQWVLADMILVQFLPTMIERFPDSVHRKEYEARLEQAALRMFGFVTGEGEGPIALDGLRVAPWRFPEAWIPVRLYNGDGTIETLWTVSKFTPLNWATAEARLAIKNLRDYLARTSPVGH